MSSVLDPRGTHRLDAAGVIDSKLPRDVPVSNVFAVIWRQKILVVAFILCAMTATASIVTRLAPYYDAQTEIMVDTRKNALSDLQVGAESLSGDALTIHTQTDILLSHDMAGRVATELDLVHNPLLAPLFVKHVSILHRLLSSFAGPATEATNAGSTAGRVDAAASTHAASDAYARQELAIGWLRQRTSVVNDGRSYTITIRARTPDPALSAEIANAYARQYFDVMRDLKIKALIRAHAWLDQQIPPLQKRMLQAEQAVEAFRDRNGLISLGSADQADGQPGRTVAGQQLGQLNGQLIDARDQLAQKQAQLQQAERALRNGAGVGALPMIVSSPMIQSLRAREAELSEKQSALEQTAGENNPQLRSVRASLSDIRRAIAVESGKILQSLREEVASGQAQVTALGGDLSSREDQVSDQSKAAVTLQQLESEAQAARSVYKDYLDRYEQTSAQAAMQEPDAALISAADVPLGPSGPPRTQFLAGALVVSVGLGGVLALVRDRLRGGFRTPEQLEAETGLFPLGFVPRSRSAKRVEQGLSPFTAAIDHVCGALMLGHDSYRVKTLLVTSAVPQEGKTALSVALAASVGRSGGRALIVDADLLHPRVLDAISPTLRLERQSLDLFNSKVGVRRDALPGVDVMTILRGTDAHLLSRLSPTDLETVLAEARQRYDLIIIDTPPVLAISDASRLASVVDGAIMVVRWRETPVAAVRTALRMLASYRMRVIGGVLTQVDFERMGEDSGTNASVYRKCQKYYRA